jgi:hypothetical protein
VTSNTDPLASYPSAYERLRVGNLNRVMDDDTIKGTQRDRGRKGKVPAAIRRRYGRLRDFDYRVFTPRLVSRRADGTHFTIDGNGSSHWVEALFGPDVSVPCIVFEGLTLAEEADLFIKAQDGKPVTKTQQFAAEQIAGEETAILMVKIAGEYDFTIDPKQLAGHVSQGAVRFVLDNFGESGLRSTFEFLKANYADDNDSFNGGFFMGIGQAVAQVANSQRLGIALRGMPSKEVRQNKSGFAGRDAARTTALRLYGEDA